ncbi:tetratricopeptide repeat protein [Psychroserpens sp. NJDZ02]|uniref:tetratricopeptide repeat protein n=1 Tax=Psychroserpens sp. NJDZ02 TaxID=2570561 RepID=UPI0010A8E087|nr:tetratricopeptide repeat protein [Psychroserpens sp. NJDZ02]QCE41504.1 tetratricopeptide repeat protein [Psychroserpens sp. NJDZ02]
MKRLFIVIGLLLLFFNAKAQTNVLAVADSLYNYGSYAKAISYYNQLEDALPYSQQIAKSYVFLGNYDQAITYYNKALNSNRSNALLKFELCKLLIQPSKLQEAEVLLLELAITDADNPNYQYYLGVVSNALEQYISAQDYFLKVFELDDSNQKVIYELAKYNLKNRSFDKVTYYVETGLKTYPNNKKLIALGGQSFYLKEDYHKAIAQFLKLVALGETTKFVYQKLGQAYGKVYNYSKAILYLEKALEQDPKDAYNHYQLGLNYQGNNNYLLAEQHISESIKLQENPLDEAYIKLGVLYNLQEKHADAIQAFTKAIKENPDSEVPHFYRVYTKLVFYNNLEPKVEEIESFSKRFPDSKYIPILNVKLSELKSQAFQNKAE